VLGAAGSAFDLLDHPSHLEKDDVGQGQFTAQTIRVNQFTNGRHINSLIIFYGKNLSPAKKSSKTPHLPEKPEDPEKHRLETGISRKR